MPNHDLTAKLSTSLDLSPSEMELICGLNLEGTDEALAYKKNLSSKLYQIYKDGKHVSVHEGKESLADEPTEHSIYYAKDKWKARKYGHIASEIELEQESFLRSQSVYAASRTFNDTRLLLLRTSRVLNALGVTALNCISQVLSFAGLSYLIRLMFDLGVILKHGLLPDNDYESKIGFIGRCGLAWNRDGRKFRMRNDAVWFVVNATSIVLSLFTGGITKIVAKVIQLAGFSFDVGHEYNEFSAVKKQENLLAKIAGHISHIESDIIKSETSIKLEKEKLNNLPLDSSQDENDHIQSEVAELEKKLEINHQEKNKYTHLRTQLENKTAKEKNLRRYIVAVTAVLFVAMTAIYLWPAYFIVFAAAAGVALVSGSIVNGFGRRMYEGIKGLFSECKKSTEVVQNKPIKHIVLPKSEQTKDAANRLSGNFSNPVFSQAALLKKHKKVSFENKQITAVTQVNTNICSI